MRGKTDSWVIILLVAIGAIALGVVQNPFSSVSGGNTYNAVVAGQCTGGNSQSLLINGQDVITGAALTESNNVMYKVNSDGTLGAPNAWTQGTAETALSVGSKYLVVPGISTSDFTDNAYGAPYYIDSLDCRVDSSIKLYQDSSGLTSTFINNANVQATAATLAASSTESVGIKLVSGKDTVFGNPYLASFFSPLADGHRPQYPNALCMRANSTWIDTSAASSWLSTGESMNMVSVPDGLVTSATGDEIVCFESPAVEDIPIYQYIQFATDAPSAGDDGALYTVPGGMFINSANGQLQWGTQTDAKAAVGETMDTETMDVTA